MKMIKTEDDKEARKTYSVREWITLVLLIAAFAYLVSPWDILSFSFFDDLAFIIVAFSV